MLDIDSGNQIEAVYKLFKIKGGKKEEIFQSNNINDAIIFHKKFIKEYRIGLYMEIHPSKKLHKKRKT